MNDKNIQEQSYDAEQIQILEGLEAVRKRPSMYIGSTNEKGLHHLVWEITDNSITASDNGRGMPVDAYDDSNKAALEIIMTVLHAGGKVGGGGYKGSGGLHGVGSAVGNALSSHLTAQVHRDGKIYELNFEKGIAIDNIHVIGETDHTGTRINFKADPEIFTETIEYDYDVLKSRIRELAFLNKKLTLVLEDKREESKREAIEFYYEGGIRSYVEYINRTRDVLHEPIYATGSDNDIEVEIAIQYNDGFASHLLSFANNINTHEGGTHEAGFRTALTRAINDYARRSNLFREDDDNLSGDDVREGLTAIVSIKHTDPQFEGQTKTKLGN